MKTFILAFAVKLYLVALLVLSFKRTGERQYLKFDGGMKTEL